MKSLCPLVCLVVLFLIQSQLPSAQRGPEEQSKPSVPVNYDGLLPGNQDLSYSDIVSVEFSIYLTPTGGRPLWTERQRVAVSNGRISILLGTTNPIPWSITTANFKFVSARISGAPEVLPRMPIVNVAYAQSQQSQDIAQHYLSTVALDKKPRPKSTWAAAYDYALKSNASLPTYLEWYAALMQGSIEDCHGHYEWTLPWVYDTASHGELNKHFRGRFEGCDYMDMDPALNEYFFRLSNKK